MEWLAKQEETFDKYRFGAMTMMITFQSCLGGIAAYLGVIHGLWAIVGISAFLAMGSNAMFIAQSKAKVCLIGFYLASIVHIIFIIIGLFMLI